MLDTCRSTLLSGLEQIPVFMSSELSAKHDKKYFYTFTLTLTYTTKNERKTNPSKLHNRHYKKSNIYKNLSISLSLISNLLDCIFVFYNTINYILCCAISLRAHYCFYSSLTNKHLSSKTKYHKYE